MRHELKTWEEPFEAVIEGRKHHEIRFDDRGYQEGDTLFLREYVKPEERYTGRAIEAEVTYLSRGPSWGLPDNMVVMSIELRSEVLHDNFPPEQEDPDVTRDLLLLADAHVPIERIKAWTSEERKLADEWASATHLAAAGHDEIPVPPKPAHVQRDEVRP